MPSRRMIRTLKQTDYAAVKRLFIEIFDTCEDKYLVPAWKGRTPAASVGFWRHGALLGCAIVRDSYLEYIFVSETCRGEGIGSRLLDAVLTACPALQLMPVDDPKVVGWYLSRGFTVYEDDGAGRKTLRRVPYDLRRT